MHLGPLPLFNQVRRSTLAACRVGSVRRHRFPLCFDYSALCTSRQWCSSSSAAPPCVEEMTPRQFAHLSSMVLLRQALRQHTLLDGAVTLAAADEAIARENHIIISREKFDEFCELSHVAEPSAALHALADAGQIVILEDGAHIHLRPAQYLAEEALLAEFGGAKRGDDFAGCVLPGSYLLEASEKSIASLRAEEMELRAQLAPAIAKAARWRRSVWGGALLYASLQLAVVARLTYFDLSWDIMEPITYCIGAGTALIFYLFYLRHGQEHTYEVFDKVHLPRKVRQYAPKSFDWARYENVCSRLCDEEAALLRLREWIKTH